MTRICRSCDSRQDDSYTGTACYFCGGRKIVESVGPLFKSETAPITTEDEAAVDAAWPESPPTAPSGKAVESRPGQFERLWELAKAGVISIEDIRTNLKEAT